MKKSWILLLFSICLLAFPRFEFTAAEDQNLTDALNSKLKETVNYYDANSVKIVDSVSLKGEVFKVLMKDNPDTEENEEKIEKYQSNIIALLVEYQKKRDHIFYFDKTDIYYYDLDKNEFLILPNVIQNKEIEEFFSENLDNLHTSMQITTTFLSVLFIFLFIVIPPYFIMTFHNKSRSSTKYSATSKAYFQG
ncbi:hypothetical protein LCL95_11640 [Bacillus timonensis]|nr:hypothetical protein [Bacillus timonensis]